MRRTDIEVAEEHNRRTSAEVWRDVAAAGHGDIVDEVVVVAEVVAVVRRDMCFDVSASTLHHISSFRSSSCCIGVTPPRRQLVPTHRRSWRHSGMFNRPVLYSGPAGSRDCMG